MFGVVVDTLNMDIIYFRTEIVVILVVGNPAEPYFHLLVTIRFRDFNRPQPVGVCGKDRMPALTVPHISTQLIAAADIVAALEIQSKPAQFPRVYRGRYNGTVTAGKIGTGVFPVAAGDNILRANSRLNVDAVLF